MLLAAQPFFIYPLFNLPMNLTTFPCPACGGPVQPEAGEAHMPCPYCGTLVNIPDALQIKTASLGTEASSSTNPTYVPPPPNNEISDVIREVAPLAAGAVAAVGFGVAARRFARRVLPACLVVLLLLCFFACGAVLLFSTMINRGG